MKKKRPTDTCSKVIPSDSETASAFVDNIFRFHGLPTSIICERGYQFPSNFFFFYAVWRFFALEITLNFSLHLFIISQLDKRIELTPLLNKCLRGFSKLQRNKLVYTKISNLFYYYLFY